MRYAAVDGLRQEARPKLRGTCLNCGREVTAKCGPQRIWHWSHLGKLECDSWWEPETEWHRSWKALFPQEWQEVVHAAADGERHVADVKNSTGWVIELQHSPMPHEERLSRENFYNNMVWVVDGLRYRRDLKSFRGAISEGCVYRENPKYISPMGIRAAIFRRWAPIQKPVFVDFGDERFDVGGFPIDAPVLWQFLLHRGTREIVVAAVRRESFLQFARLGRPLEYVVGKHAI